MSDLPVLKPRKPVAKCGFCGSDLFAGDYRCKMFPVNDCCPVNGDEWQSMERMRAMQNTYVGAPKEGEAQ